jgi:predicted nucleic acid-binding protein
VIVVDASALVNALTDDGPSGDHARRRIAEDPAMVAPEHLRVEVFSAVRGRYLGGKITPKRAIAAIDALGELAISTVDTPPLLVRMWELRDRLRGYDAAYAVVAEVYECQLASADVTFLNAVRDLRICDVDPV